MILVDCFTYFDQFGKIDTIIRKSKKRWNSFENIPSHLQSKFMKYADQRDFISGTGAPNNANKEYVIGDIGSIERTLNWMLEIASNCSKDKRSIKDAKLLKNSCEEMLKNLGQNDVKCDNDAINNGTIWSPFSYLFQYLLQNFQDVYDTLEWIRANVPVSSFLLPVSMCIIEDINGNIHIGFSVSTTPNLRPS